MGMRAPTGAHLSAILVVSCSEVDCHLQVKPYQNSKVIFNRQKEELPLGCY